MLYNMQGQAYQDYRKAKTLRGEKIGLSRRDICYLGDHLSHPLPKIDATD